MGHNRKKITDKTHEQKRRVNAKVTVSVGSSVTIHKKARNEETMNSQNESL